MEKFLSLLACSVLMVASILAVLPVVYAITMHTTLFLYALAGLSTAVSILWAGWWLFGREKVHKDFNG